MAKFSGKTAVKQPRKLRAPIQTTGVGLDTFEGGRGYSRDPKSDLFLLAVTNMVGQDTFYESASQRDQRFADLVRVVSTIDPEWMQGFIPFLRNEMFMRSAAVVAAAEYVASGAPNGASVVASALKRADEPAELIGYWHQTHGRNEPKPIKRGIARAVQRLYTQDAALKYDGNSRSVRMGDVLERVHARPVSEEQSALFAYLLDRRHHSESVRADLTKLSRLQKTLELDSKSEDELRAIFREQGPLALASAGYTWERLSGKMKMDAEAWEAIIPQMGYMALLRNLRNFNEAGISKASEKYVTDVLTDPERVAKSMQFPYRFYSAYKATGDLKYAQALETALDLSTQNIPELRGRSLILVDVSGSMMSSMSNSQISPWEQGALFGVAQFMRAENADLVAFATGNKKISLKKGTSVLRGIEQVGTIVRSGSLNMGTNTWQAVQAHYDGHDRVVVFSDMQSTSYSSYGGEPPSIKTIPTIYNFNLRGYGRANMDTSQPGRYELGGFSDAVFRIMGLLERGKNAPWPWE